MDGKNNSYKYQTLLGKRTWSNTHLKVDGVGLVTNQLLTPVTEDVINLLLFGGAARPPGGTIAGTRPPGVGPGRMH